MAHYKPYSYAQGQFIPIHFAQQILLGTKKISLRSFIRLYQALETEGRTVNWISREECPTYFR